MYICKPERSVTQTKWLMAICITVTSGLFLAASLMPEYAATVRFAGIAAMMVSILLVVRYSLTEFEYYLDADSFGIVRITGNRRQTVVCVSLETAISLLAKAEYKALPKNEKAIIKYSLNQNILADTQVYLCEFNGKRCKIEFEPNAEFASILRGRIGEEKAKRG